MLRRLLIFVLLVFLVPLGAHALWWRTLDHAPSWNQADWSSAGLPPAPEAAPGAMVRVNAFASTSLVRDFALSKAAGSTKAAGGTHFTLTNIEEGVALQPVQANGGRIATYRHPTLKAVVTLVRVKSGEALPAGAREAEEVIRTRGWRMRI